MLIPLPARRCTDSFQALALLEPDVRVEVERPDEGCLPRVLSGAVLPAPSLWKIWENTQEDWGDGDMRFRACQRAPLGPRLKAIATDY
jgi:hypothetical protein